MKDITDAVSRAVATARKHTWLAVIVGLIAIGVLYWFAGLIGLDAARLASIATVVAAVLAFGTAWQSAQSAREARLAYVMLDRPTGVLYVSAVHPDPSLGGLVHPQLAVGAATRGTLRLTGEVGLRNVVVTVVDLDGGHHRIPSPPEDGHTQFDLPGVKVTGFVHHYPAFGIRTVIVDCEDDATRSAWRAVRTRQDTVISESNAFDLRFKLVN